MLDVWFAQAFQAYRRDAIGKTQEPRLHIGRKGRDFRGNSFVEDLYPPSHECKYISFLRYWQAARHQLESTKTVGTAGFSAG